MEPPRTDSVTLVAALRILAVMLTEASGELSEAKAAELLGINLIAYRGHKEQAIKTVLALAHISTSPLLSVVEVMQARPELFE